MRIALVTETFYPATDGTTTTLKAVADGLVDRGHTVELIAPGPGLGNYRGRPVHRIRPLEPVGAQVRSALDRFEPDLIHVTSPGSLGRKALKHAQRTGTRSVMVEQSPVLDLAADYWRSRIAGRADQVLVTSSWMVERASELGVETTLWRPGVDTVAFTPSLRDQWLHDAWSHQGKEVVVGYVGSLHKRHGVRRLPELAAIPGVRLVLIGGGPQHDWLEPRLPGAKFTGPLQTGDLTIALPTLDVVVHPGEHETCSHALREAAASGVPVVAPRSGGATDVVKHLETGLLYDPRDPRDLTRAVTSIVADKHRGLLGEHARETVQSRTWHDAIDELISLVEPVRVS